MGYKIIERNEPLSYMRDEKPPRCDSCINNKISHRITYDRGMVLASDLPQLKWTCSCGKVGYTFIDYGDMEWVSE